MLLSVCCIWYHVWLIYKQVKYNTDHDDMNGYESSIQWETDHKVANNRWMIF